MLNVKLHVYWFVMAVCIALFGCASTPEGVAGSDSRPDNANTDQFIVGPSAIVMPQGVFLLIRKGPRIGALRFTSIVQGQEVGVGKASYESYFQNDGSGLFRGSDLAKETGEIDLQPLKGVGRFSFQLGKRKITVGPWAFACDYPGRLDMWPYGKEEGDFGFEFAPTAARDVREIDPSNSQLHWHRFNRNTRIQVRVSDLPK